MNIVVIHGSPTGKDSITLQYAKFLQQRVPGHTFEVLDMGRGLRRLENDPALFDATVESMVKADGILWSFPVYTSLAPSSLVRFVELLFARLPKGLLAGKPATTMTTSEHFFDHTAHNYMEEVSEDLGMHVMRGFSAQSEEIMKEEGRRNFLAFVHQFLRSIEEKEPCEVHHRPVSWTAPTYETTLGEKPGPQGTRRVTVVTDAGAQDHNLTRIGTCQGE